MTSDLRRRNLNIVHDTLSHSASSFREVSSNLLEVVYEQHNFRHNLTSDMIVTLTLGIGTLLLCATNLLIMFYLSVKFR